MTVGVFVDFRNDKFVPLYKKILRNHDNFLPDISDKFGIYICKDYCCNLPVRTLSEVKRILD